MKNRFESLVAGSVLLVSATALAAGLPEVSSVTMSQADNRKVTIGYTLKNSAAVITLDIQTNCTMAAGVTNWVSIGGQNIDCFSADSAVWRKVEAGDHTITWSPHHSWAGRKIGPNGIRAVVTAWDLTNTPDYMVVDLLQTGGENPPRYYPAADYLPGGLLKNQDYCTTKLVMRKCPAKGVTWTIGSINEDPSRPNEKPREITLDSNYYIAVFPMTLGQWQIVYSKWKITTYPQQEAVRPVRNVAYNVLRCNNANNTDYYGGSYPDDPTAYSFLGELRKRTGIDFDLPSDAQWEYAARAGQGSGYWNNGKPILALTGEDKNLPGWYKANSSADSTSPFYNAPCRVGMFEPNAWGIYDIHGNVCEFCLDAYIDKPTSSTGAVYVPAANMSTANKVVRGGAYAYDPGSSRSAYRWSWNPTTQSVAFGFRVACKAGLD